jgi:hypothetical protein
MLRVLTLAVLVLLARVATAQENCSSDTLLAIDTKSGHFLSSSDLKPADLNATVNGKPLSILGTEPEGDKTTVVIFMDASGSMAKASNIEFELARRIVAALPPAQPTMIVEFAEHSELVASDRAGTEKWLQTVAALRQDERRTALWDAIDKTLGTVSSQRPIFLLLSDGGDNMSKVHADAVLRKLQENQVRLIWVETVETSTKEAATPEERQGGDKTAEVAGETGGGSVRSVHGFLESSFVNQVRSAIDVIGAYSRVRFDFPPGTPRTGKLKITVAPDRPELKGAQLVYLDRLRDCSTQAASH